MNLACGSEHIRVARQCRIVRDISISMEESLKYSIQYHLV